MQDLVKYGYLRVWQVLELYPIGKSTWWAGVKTGRYPKPIKLGPRTTAWRTQDIHELLAGQGTVTATQSDFQQSGEIKQSESLT